MEFQNATSGHYYPAEYDETEEMNEPESLRNIAMCITAFLSVSGIIGNILVLYVFSRQKQKPSSTIFILTLAGTDFMTSLVTMPYTISMELSNYQVEFDAVCKIYHFLVTTTIPFSAFVMVAIAVDRYLCIVHPFKHTMTIRRAKVTVVCLAVLAATLGLLCCLMYGVRGKSDYDPKVIGPDNANGSVVGAPYSINMSDEVMAWHMGNNSIYSHYQPVDEIINTGKCHRNGMILGDAFFNVYQKIYSGFYGVCAVIVIVLYAIIYRSVFTRRRQRLHLTNRCCGFWTQTSMVEQDHEQTEFTILNSGSSKKQSINGGSPTARDDSTRDNTKNGNGNTEKEGNNTTEKAADKDALVRPSGVSRAKLEKLRRANIKTALMLSLVAFVYIICFMPAWLMAHHVVPMNVIVFYLYFLYSVVNPVIYAFLNQSFRNHLQALFKCGS